MLRYILKRLIVMIPVVIGVAIVIFSIMYFVPGDPARIILGDSATPADLEHLRDKLGLSGSYLVRLGRFLSNVFLRFDLGTSYYSGSTVTSEILQRFPSTLIIAVFSVIASALIGIPLGVTAAVHQNTFLDRICMFLTITLYCIPQFWLALMLVILFSLKLNWLPAYGIGGIEYFIIPIMAITAQGFAGLSRQTRSSMLEIIRSDYVITARSQGFSEHDLTYKFALPNALIPVITVLGSQFAYSLGGTIIIETVFSIPGLGLYISGAISQRDYPIIQGSVVFLSIIFCAIMLLVDIGYAMIDPRVKSQFETAGKRRLGKV